MKTAKYAEIPSPATSSARRVNRKKILGAAVGCVAAALVLAGLTMRSSPSTPNRAVSFEEMLSTMQHQAPVSVGRYMPSSSYETRNHHATVMNEDFSRFFKSMHMPSNVGFSPRVPPAHFVQQNTPFVHNMPPRFIPTRDFPQQHQQQPPQFVQRSFANDDFIQKLEQARLRSIMERNNFNRFTQPNQNAFNNYQRAFAPLPNHNVQMA